MSIAIIAGTGALPAALVAASAVSGAARPLITALEGFAPDSVVPDLSFRIERLYPFFGELHRRGIRQVVFAGAVRRPRLEPELFDPQTASIVPRLMGALAQGDDATLREVIALFEEEDLAVVGADQLAPDLVPGEAIWAGEISARDRSDAARAALITEALGRVDVGQGAVVQQGLCLATETIAGTDAMLATVAGLPNALRPQPAGGKGLLYKAPKPLQDRRIDLPALGVDSVLNAAQAGLGGIVWQAGGVLCLDLPGMQQAARERGMFLWARAAGEAA